MKKLLLLKLLLFTGFISFAQTTYTATYSANAGYPGGIRPSTSSTTETTGWDPVLGTSSSTFAANLWSPTQTIPFAFSFFGQPVTDYKVSANMLLTFDVASAALPNANDNLPTVNLPDKTIAIFWDEFTNAAPTGSGDRVMSKVFGTAPNRQLWVVWYSFEYGNPNISFAYNAAVLEETTNKIYVVDLYNNGTPALTTTVGLQLNSTTAVQAGNNQVNLGPNTSAIVADVDFYQFAPRPVVATDAAATALLTPTATGCYTATQPVEITITNFGTSPISNIPVAASITGVGSPQTITGTYTGTLAPNASANVVVGTANMTASGTYSIKAYTNLANDLFRGNDTLATQTFTVTPLAALPQTVDFTGFTGANLTTLFPNWREATGATTPAGTTSAWANDGFGNVTSGPNGTGASINLWLASKRDWIVGPKILATATTALKFDLALTAYNVTTAATMGSDDVFQVMISTDCGLTYTPIRTYNATTPISNTGQSELVNLGAYAGQQIIVAFFASEGTVDDPEDNELHIDNIFLGTPPALDMGITAMVSPAVAGCFTAAQPVTVTIQNFGSNTINFATNPVTVIVNVTGAVTQTLTFVVNTGTLAPGATQNVVAGNLNMTAPGTYTFNASTSVTGDGNPANDALPALTRTVTAVATLPQMVDFTGFTGANLTTLFPNWREAAGTTPTGTSSLWANRSGLGGASNVTAQINLYTNNRSEWIIGPKVIPTANSALRFKAAITDYSNLNADPDGMQGTDDKVRVMVSTDCGLTFTPIYTFDASNTANLTNVLTDQIFPLGAYAGQQIIVAFYATDGPADDNPDYDFHIDDVEIAEVSPTDLGALALVSPVTFGGCYGTAQNVIIGVKNYGTAPFNFATNNVTVTANVTGAATQTLTFNITDNTLNNGQPLAVGATLNVPVGSLNMSTLGAYTFNASTAFTTGTDPIPGNNAMAPATITVVAPVAGTASASPINICQSGTPVLSLTGNTGGNIQWQQATAPSGPFTNIAGATTATYTLASPATQTTYYKAVVSCGTNSDTTTSVLVTVNNPAVTAFTGGTRCGTGTVNLTATPSAGTTINWYDTATGGTPLATGNTYAPTVSTSTTFYAEASTGVTEKVGKMSTTGVDGTNTGGGLIFNASAPFTLDSVVVYSALTAGGNLIVNLKDASGTILQTATVALPPVTSRTAIVVPLNFSVPAGTGLRLEQGSSLGLYRDYSASAGISYPYTSPSQLVTITNGTLAGYYYFFYRWSVSNKCASARTAVAVTVSPGPATPAVTASGPTSFCTGGSVTLTASSATPGVTYQWFNNGTAIAGATAATYTASASGSYTVTALTGTCSSSVSQATAVTVNTKPAAPTITVAAGGSTTICQGSSVTLTGASSTAGVTYRWSRNGAPIAGATAATYSATTAGNYRVIASTGGACSDSSAVTAITVNPKPAMPVITKTGNLLTSTATTGTYQWFSVSGSNLTAVPGAIAQTFTPAVNGNYTVRVTVNGCQSDAAATMNVVLGIAALAPGMEVSIYPNPTAGKFAVELKGFEKEASIQIINVTGQVIAAEKVAITGDVTSRAFNLNGMAKGVYILKVTSGDNLTFRKVILD